MQNSEDEIKSLKAEVKSLRAENRELKQVVSEPLEHQQQTIEAEKKIKDQNEKLKKYNLELEQFTYVATHDLKSPLTNIQGYLDLLELDLVDPSEDIKDSLKWLKYSVAEARSVIVELTNALKARNNKEELLSSINLEELVESILSGMRSTILEKSIIFISDLSELNIIKYYPVALRSILQNIISNAIQYIGDSNPAEIHITSSSTESHISISIQDNGLGIDLEKDKAKVFGLFKRVSNDQNGSGIGMFIVNNLLKNYGGELAVESEIGKGSTFTVIIPNETNKE
ncbi:sensor histidine kinase [Crocinitomix catalasitica]|uniref:sensor histidine kinase n=1 Tax=Crocinitomix catalasitica TaxID=184607 RepID=UPI00146FBB57|nr:HAMP domain-containing sensor histidine kinase [Crocinitomix catalasitica]